MKMLSRVYEVVRMLAHHMSTQRTAILGSVGTQRAGELRLLAALLPLVSLQIVAILVAAAAVLAAVPRQLAPHTFCSYKYSM